MWGWELTKGQSIKSILSITPLEISNLPEALSTTSFNLPMVLPAWMEELMETEYYLQGDHPTHQRGKRKQRSSTSNVPLSRKGIKASALRTHHPCLQLSKDCQIGAWASKIPLPLKIRIGLLIWFSPLSLTIPMNSAGRNSFTPCYLSIYFYSFEEKEIYLCPREDLQGQWMT